jgi:hypothetical protein
VVDSAKYFSFFICYISFEFKLSGFVTAASHQILSAKSLKKRIYYEGFEEAHLKFYQEEAGETDHKQV